MAGTCPGSIDAIGVLSGVGDVFSGQPVGFSLRVAMVAGRFCVYRGWEPPMVAAAYYAAALHRIGAIRVVLPRDASPRFTEIRGWDDPPAGAALVSALGGFPPGTGDAIRWHRESFDGSGFPDHLRWENIPETAMTVNIARAFVATLDEQGGSPFDAVFALTAQIGGAFALEPMSAFREFVGAQGTACLEPFEPTWELPLDPHATVARICSEIDARLARTTGRGERLEHHLRALVARLPDLGLDPDAAAFAGRLTALARTGLDGSDDALTVTRLGIEARAARAAATASIVGLAPGFAALGTSLGALEEWYDGSGLPGGASGSQIDPLARVLAVAVADEALTAGDRASRVAAAAGSRLDPAVVAAYLDVRGQP